MEETTLGDVRNYDRYRNAMDSLRDTLSNNREAVVLWVGAGTSVSSGMPGWGQFLLETARALPEEDREVVQRIVARGFLDIAADYMSEAAGDHLKRAMLSSFGRDPVQTPLWDALRRLDLKTIITTNYDRVLETAVPRLALTPQTYRHQVYRDSDTILKVHGSVEQPDTWVLSRSQYARHYNADLAEDLRHIFRHRTVLFVGCSLQRDQYLDVLADIPPHMRSRHYAVLCVNSREEGKLRGEDLERYGISIFPYMTAGPHRFVTEFLRFLEPPFAVILKRVRAALAAEQFDYAARTLKTWTEGQGREGNRRALADALSYAAGVLARTPGWLHLAEELTAHAFRLDPTSREALTVRLQVLESQGADTAEVRSRLRRIEHASIAVYKKRQPSGNALLEQTYLAYRTGDVDTFNARLEVVERGGLPPRLSTRVAVLRLRAHLQESHPAAAGVSLASFSPAIQPAQHFAESLIAYHGGAYAEALAPVKWQTSGFELHVKGCCELGLGRFDDALATFRHCLQRYAHPGGKVQRVFKDGRTPTELAYDARRLGSDELYAIIDAWTLVAEIAAEVEISTARLQGVYQRLRAPDRDHLMLGLQSVLSFFVPAFDENVSAARGQAFENLIHGFKNRNSGILRDLHVASFAMRDSQLASPEFASAVEMINRAM